MIHSALAGAGALDDPLAASESLEETIRRAVRVAAVESLRPSHRPQRRKGQRFPFPYLLALTPVERDTLRPLGAPIVAAGKHLSELGLGFYHQQPIAFRHVVAAIELPQGEQIHVLMDLRWCRFTKFGWYESGGQFLHAVEPPETTVSCRGKTV